MALLLPIAIVIAIAIVESGLPLIPFLGTRP